METLNFKSFDGEMIYCYLFLPKVKPRGIVQIVHGLEEHGLRYEEFAQFLNSHGLIVLASDQRLHGKTAGENLSKTNIKNIFPVMVKDQCGISKMLKEKYNLPLLIFGHSYGSFIVQRYIEVCSDYDGAILSGSAYMKRPETLLAKWLSWSVVKVRGGAKESNLIENLVISSFNKSFKNGESWISANKENVKKYENDPLCGKPLCANFYFSMFKNTRNLYNQKSLSKIDKTKPILLASGKDDPVGLMGKSTTKLYKTYLKNNLNVSLLLYENLRHEIINEGDKKVYNDILAHIEKCLQNKKHIE